MIEQTEKEAVQIFAEAMVAKLNIRRSKYKRFGWRDPEYKSMEELEQHLLQELKEHIEAPDDLSELVDIANSAFMLWDRKKNVKTDVIEF